MGVVHFRTMLGNGRGQSYRKVKGMRGYAKLSHSAAFQLSRPTDPTDILSLEYCKCGR